MAQNRTTTRNLRDKPRRNGTEGCGNPALHDPRDALRIHEKRYRQILDNISDGVYQIDTRGYFTYLNNVSIKRSGLSPDRYPSCHYLEIVTPEDRELARSNFERVMRGEETPPYELRVKGPDGRTHIREVKSRPVFENGRVVELLGISRDITARKQAEEIIVNAKAFLERVVGERTDELARKSARLEEEIERRKIVADKLRESEERYRTIFENTGTAMLIVEDDNAISLVNSEFEKMSGYIRKDVEGKARLTDFLSESEIRPSSSRPAGQRGAAPAAAEHFECQAVDKYGQIRDIFATASEIPGARQWIVSMLDITERKRSIETIRKREAELAARNLELEEVNTALKVLLKRREGDRKETEEKVSANIQNLVLPHLAKLKKRLPGARERSQINTIESILRDIFTPSTQKLSSQILNLTPKEIQVANLIRAGKTTKEIAEHMDVSKCAIDTHRHHIRGKLGLKNKKVNLFTYLHSLS